MTQTFRLTTYTSLFRILAGFALLATPVLWGQEALQSFFTDGEPLLDMRLRYESADSDAPRADEPNLQRKSSDALTLRTRLGFETASYNHISGLVEMEDIRLITNSDEVNLAGQNPATAPTHTAIPDPEETELNQAWLQYAPESFNLRGGRQRIILNDSRFVGNVGWRQNEQTYDAIRFQGRLNNQLSWDYSHVWKVQRILGDDSPAGSDFEGQSHLLDLNYTLPSNLSVTGFVYLQALETLNGSDFMGANDTFGIRISGTDFLDNPDWTFNYTASYAMQMENHNTPAEIDFDLNYWLFDAKVEFAYFTVGGGLEILEGNGNRQFTTPLATVHKFQGWADVFLGASVSGTAFGGGGVEDYYLNASTTLPVANGINTTAIYHVFESNSTSSNSFNARYGKELNLVASYPITKQIKALLKFADYRSKGGNLNPTVDTRKFWAQVELSF